MTCEYQHFDIPCEGEVKNHHSMTAYSYTEEDRKAGKEDPNRNFLACEAHYHMYRYYWKEMWAEYYSAVGYPGCDPYRNDWDIHEPTVVDEFNDFISDPEDI